MNCMQCRHYNFYLMITQGPYLYAGNIPCHNCSRFSCLQDNFVPVTENDYARTDNVLCDETTD